MTAPVDDRAGRANDPRRRSGLDPNSLQAVQEEGTQTLPGLPLKSKGND